MIGNLKHTIILLCAAYCVAPVAAQSGRPTVTARISPDSIMIGDRFTLEIDVERDQVQVVEFPHFDKSIGDDKQQGGQSIECIEELPVDTLAIEGRRLRLRKRYTMAAFDEGVYSFGRAQVLYADKNIIDTIYAADSLRIAVATFQIDSTSHAIFDIKPQRKMPLRFGEFSGYLLWGLLILAILVLGAWGLAVWLHKHGRKLADIFRPAPPLPPHIVAIAALEKLHNEKLWQSNRHKQYYSGLSDILRTYLAGRYDVGAMEMATDEIVDAVKGLDMPQKSAMDLVSVLRESDLVKFAKAMPEATENEDTYHKAYYFVEETKPVEEPTEPTDEDAPTHNPDATVKRKEGAR